MLPGLENSQGGRTGLWLILISFSFKIRPSGSAYILRHMPRINGTGAILEIDDS